MPHGMSTMPSSTQTWVFKKSSTAEVPSIVHDYNPTRTRYFNPFHGILSYADWNDGGQLTYVYNMVHEISLEGTSSRQAVYRLNSCQHISLGNTLYSDCWFDTIKKNLRRLSLSTVVQSIYLASTCFKRMIKTTKGSESVLSVPQDRFRYRTFVLHVILHTSN
jgi:hypothetical protein